MNHYIIDGNNLIGKIKSLSRIHVKDKQSSRAQLVSLLNGYFAGKKCNLTLHLDGHANTPLHLSKGKIVYSENRISDYMIRQEIDNAKNKKLLILISSDHSLMNYAKVNSCTVMKSEEFGRQIHKTGETNQEMSALKQLEQEKSYFHKLFSGK
ncbi:MAG: NYN domain-containing protein [Ignavibacteria bacterium]|nr:NYN domain-containing protein [Ignavibacteria bacterium]